jgi:hypothetical protein
VKLNLDKPLPAADDRDKNDPFVSIAIRSSLRAKLRLAAAKKDMKFGDFVSRALEKAAE